MLEYLKGHSQKEEGFESVAVQVVDYLATSLGVSLEFQVHCDRVDKRQVIEARR